MVSYLDTHEPFRGNERRRRPDALLLLAGHEALTWADPTVDDLRGCDKGP